MLYQIPLSVFFFKLRLIVGILPMGQFPDCLLYFIIKSVGRQPGPARLLLNT